jgi:glycosyltransferase involved in cell wall biosynthesis
VYVSYDGALEPLGRSQVLAYLFRLAADTPITLISFEKDLDGAPELETSLREAGIRWRPLAYHRRPPVLSTAADVAAGAAALQRELRRLPGAIVHVRSYVPAQIALATPAARRHPLLFDIRGFWADERVDGGIWPRGGLYRLAKRREARFLARADAVVTLTHASTGWLRERVRPGVPVAVIPTCAEVERFAATRRRDGDPHLVWAGSVGTWYDFDLAVALARATGAPFDVLTRAGDEARAALGDTPASVGSVPHEEMPGTLRAGDVGLALYRPSFSRIATAPTRVAEYLAAGMPVAVSPGVGDMEALIAEEGVGVVVRERGEEALRAAFARLRELAADDALVRRCREVAARRFATAAGADAYRALYSRL